MYIVKYLFCHALPSLTTDLQFPCLSHFYIFVVNNKKCCEKKKNVFEWLIIIQNMLFIVFEK